jgi:hypothetical protein
MPLTLAIDFDNVIHDINNPIPGKRMGGPMPGALESLEALYDQGHQIIIHTMRGNSPSVQDWLDHYGIDYHHITNVKPGADLYIDDKALRFENWVQVMALFPDPDDVEDNE